MTKKPGVNLKIARQLLQIGVMSARLGRFDDAEKMIRAVRAFRPDLPHPRTALATMYLFQQRFDEAASVLTAVLQEFPQHQLGRAFLALVKRELGRPGWRNLAEEVIADGRDEAAVELASYTLGIDAPRPAAAPLPVSRIYA
jgi:predicted Zn-dependent protease